MEEILYSLIIDEGMIDDSTREAFKKTKQMKEKTMHI